MDLPRLDELGWIDITAIAVLLLAFIVGLCKGFVWQLGRILSVLIGLGLAVNMGPDAGQWLAQWLGDPGAPLEEQRVFLYSAWALLFVFGLLVVGLLAGMARRAVTQSGLSFFDRVGGGFLGAGMGAVAFLAVASGAFLFLPTTSPVQAAESSHAIRYGRAAIDQLGAWAPAAVRRVYELEAVTDAPVESEDEKGQLATEQPEGDERTPEMQPRAPLPDPLARRREEVR